MRSAHAIGSGKQQRNVIALALVLCLWLVTYASHLHARDDSASTEPSTACSFCVSLPAGAAAPAAPALHAPMFASCGSVATVFTTLVDRDVPSAYRSRAPPAL